MKMIHALMPVALLTAATSGCSDSTGASSPAVTATAVAGSDGQFAFRGTALPRPLAVQVISDGAPIEGVAVTWQPSAGSIQLTSNLTNAAGLASATWTLGDAPGPMTATATTQGAGGPPVVFTATALPLISVVADRATDNQSGVVGTALPRPLRVQVLVEGVPAAGFTVSWQRPGLSIVSETGADGFAEATVTLPNAAGSSVFVAQVSGAFGSPVYFQATATSGTIATITKQSGDSQALPANFPEFLNLWVKILDQFGNPVSGATVNWSVQSGPLAVSWGVASTNADGQAWMIVRPTGSAGVGLVRATLPGLADHVDFVLTVEAPRPLVILKVGVETSFVSRMNGTEPAVDTIPVGGTMTWLLSDEDLEYHEVASVGDPSFIGGGLGYGGTHHGVEVTFPMPGTYHYEDPYWPGMIATLVVQ